MKEAIQQIGATEKSSRFTTFVFRMGLFCLCFVALFRLVSLQLASGPLWRVQAEGNRRQRVTVRAPRGMILDRNGVVVARNSIQLVEPYSDDRGRLQERVVGADEGVQLQATAPAKIKKMYVRQYPFGPILSHVLGYTSRAQFSSDVVTGAAGIEQHLNRELTGFDGEIWYERTALGKAQRILAEREPQVGETVTLTIDAALSEIAYNALGDQVGSVVVTTPRGEVLVAVSTPSFIPQYSRDQEESSVTWPGNPAPDISTAVTDQRSPLLFRAVAGIYPPGSVFKIVTSLAGLEREAITSTTTVNDEGELKVGDFTYQNWYWRQYGRAEGNINVVRALARSNDIFFYRLAEWVGPDALAEFAGWFGFGTITGIEGQREQAGLVPTPAWKQERFGERWYLGNTFHIGIGQGDLLVTPVQVALMMNTVATQGRQCELHALPTNTPRCQEISLQPETWQSVIQGLRQACSPGGTAYPFFETAYDVMCKTGTAEFGLADHRGYRPTHGWFTAAVSSGERQSAESTDFEPEIIVTVMVESDQNELYKEGSSEAAPIALTVVEAWLAQKEGREISPVDVVESSDEVSSSANISNEL